ncbi:MAG TPA: PQQ-binding-like beta-propeller repeat protein [Acidobacteriota bacterium]|nr:PQQ-binding-like beta-propeller repeat protein [Acidobacteriota bacterium]
MPADPLEDPCATPGTDNWPTWSHDYRHTGASTIPVGDPNGITLAWTRQLPSGSPSTNPTVANGIVYISSLSEVSAFDLTTGLPIPGSPFTGTPEMGYNNTGNTTIHNGVAYVTGGNWEALTALPLGDLNKAAAFWSNNNASPDPLLIASRFNALTVIEDLDSAGTDVLFITDWIVQSVGGIPGQVFALDAATGELYDGWPTNPIDLQPSRYAYHGPAYDGENLFVASALGGSTPDDGAIWSIDARTGQANWMLVDDIDPSNVGGFPGGVSLEGDFLYAATCDHYWNGRRLKIDKSGPEPVVVWAVSQSRALYCAPTIGRDNVYFPQDNAPGVLVVDKETGDLVHDFGANGVGEVPQNIALSCDNYLFVGDRNTRWWILNANTLEPEFYRQYSVPGTGTVNGTVLATDTAGNHYAVVSISWDGTSGRVSAYRLNTGPRPRLEQNVFSAVVEVPYASGTVLTYSLEDVFSNVGNAPLTFTGFTVETQGAAEQTVGSLTTSGTSTPRTTTVRINGELPAAVDPAATASLELEYSCTGLRNGTEVEMIQIVCDDPDFSYDGPPSVATIEVTYVGACNCHTDPQCDGIPDVLDVVTAIGVAFRSAPPAPDPKVQCPYETTDTDCSGFTDVLDVVRFVNVIFRSADLATEFCDPCGP